jgi:hypothetical protein
MNRYCIPRPYPFVQSIWPVILFLLGACGGGNASVTDNSVGDPRVVSRQAFQEAVSLWEMSDNPDLSAIAH